MRQMKEEKGTECWLAADKREAEKHTVTII